MIVANRDKLVKFWKAHGDSKLALQAWYREVAAANWQIPQDIKDRYPSASFLHNNFVIFNIKGNRYRLEVRVNYAASVVGIEWIGTHAQYSKSKKRG